MVSDAVATEIQDPSASSPDDDLRIVLTAATVRSAVRYRWYSLALFAAILVFPIPLPATRPPAATVAGLLVTLAVGNVAIAWVLGRGQRLRIVLAVSAVVDLVLATGATLLLGPVASPWVISLALPYLLGGIESTRVISAAAVVLVYGAAAAGHGVVVTGTAWSDAIAGAVLPTTIAGGLVFALMRFGHRLSRRLGVVRTATERAARGELTLGSSDEARDELGLMERSFHRMLETFADTIASIQREAEESAVFADLLSEAARGVLRSSETVSETATELARDMESQKSHADRGRGSTLQATEEASELKDRATKVASGAENLLQTARAGRESVQRASETLLAIGDDVRSTADSVQVLSAMSERISSFATTISRIARQTHVLALNAAIEAANSDSDNEGFTAVAEEVRLLAAEAGSSGSEVGELVDELRERIEAVARAMSSGEAKVKNVGVVADEAQQSLDELLQGVSQITGLVASTADVSTKQATRMADLASEMTEIASLSTRSSDGAQRAADAMSGQRATIEDLTTVSHQLTNMAARVRSSVSKFSLERNRDG